MPLYTFRCPQCGSFDLASPMSAIPTDPPCPTCTTASSRVFDPPRLATFGAGRHRLADLAAASAERPTLTRSVPAALGRPTAPPRRPGRPALPRP